MTSTDLIVKKLPIELQKIAMEYNIPDTFLDARPELVALVLNSKSMDTKEEKQSWFNLVPLMNDEQINKLNDILVREKQKLQEIESKYDKKKEDVINKYVQKRDEKWYENKIVELKQKEAIQEQEESHEEEKLLQQI